MIPVYFINFTFNRHGDSSTPLQLGKYHCASQRQCNSIPKDDGYQPEQNSIGQPERYTDAIRQTEYHAYLMSAFEPEKPPYLRDHAHCCQKSADKSDQENLGTPY